MNLVTGATGHIGNVLVRQLLEDGRPVRALVLPGEDLAPLAGLDAQLVQGNVLDPASLDQAMQGVEVVYHLAGVISILPGCHEALTQINVQGTRNVIEAARRAGVRRLVYTSSIHAIQRVERGVRVDEHVPFDPDCPLGAYDRSKAAASLAVLEAVHGGLDAVIVCPTGVIGPFDYRLSEMGNVIRTGMRSSVQFYVDGAYDFVDVRDVARGAVLAGDRGCCGEVYILSGEQIEVVDLLAQVRRRAGRRAVSLKVPLRLALAAAGLTPLFCRWFKSRPMFTRYSLEILSGNSLYSCEKARRDLGYAPRPVRESLSDAVGWFTEHQRRGLGFIRA